MPEQADRMLEEVARICRTAEQRIRTLGHRVDPRADHTLGRGSDSTAASRRRDGRLTGRHRAKGDEHAELS
jgi:hypothetical protein